MSQLNGGKKAKENFNGGDLRRITNACIFKFWDYILYTNRLTDILINSNSEIIS